ncbi:MAG TPA: GMC family oxidoreductase N-terminal domain-containing protein [Polyangiaceae bacterium LLY-WYZ-15_(1-7)]|nr:GMC family oxidoreductase N-terminal domain-containing protein [Polyangiaceae bacterium LLY-WYZ-15_(1-7)]
MSAAGTFDYVVVGGGSAGCILAAELSKDARVLLLEAGPHAEAHPETLSADGYKEAFTNDALLHERFSVKDPRWGDRRLFMGSGRTLGGSGSINAMVYTRGAREDFDQWPEGWRWDDVAAGFEALERTLRPHRRPPTDWTERSIRAAELAGFRRSEDLNDGDLSGVLGYEWMSYEGDRRRSSFAAFLQPALGRETLRVETEAFVEKVLFEGTRAVGVRWRQGDAVHEARASREVILTAGALASPAILLRSGVGPAAALRALGIDVVLDRGGVGENLHDHPNVQLFFRGSREVDCHYPQLYGFHRANPASDLPPGQADSCYVFYPARSSFREGLLRLLPGIALPEALYDVPAFPKAIRGAVDLAFRRRLVQRFVARMWGIVVILGKPKSRGRLSLKSADPSVRPAIDPGYFADPEDMETLLLGVDKARAVAAQTPLQRFGASELLPGPFVRSRRALERWARANVMTTYHYAGTCRMGTDADAVVDTRLRLNGAEGLRVCDASVMPITPVAALNAPSMLIALRAAHQIAEAHAGPAKTARA